MGDSRGIEIEEESRSVGTATVKFQEVRVGWKERGSGIVSAFLRLVDQRFDERLMPGPGLKANPRAC